MRYLLLLAVFTGCTPEVEDFVPMIAVCVGVSDKFAPDNPDTPDNIEDCANCGGLGYVGDGVIRSDCPECEIPWEAASGGKMVGLIIELYAEHQDEINAHWATLGEEWTLSEAVVSWAKQKLKPEPQSEPPSKQVAAWEQTLSEARQRAVEEDKPLVVFFTANSCAPCRLVDRAFEEPEVFGAVQDVVRVKVVYEESPEVFAKWRVRSTPWVVAAYRGKTVYSRSPPREATLLAQEMRSIQQLAGEK